MDVGALWGLRAPALSEVPPGSPATFPHCVDTAGTSVQQDATATTCPAGQTFVSGVNPFKEFFLGNTPRPRVSIGIGINWNSPFGPFRIDIAKALITAPGDNTKLLTFNVGTAF
jgi:outer membrane protein insertion porin family